jgi:hypothetical protein
VFDSVFSNSGHKFDWQTVVVIQSRLFPGQFCVMYFLEICVNLGSFDSLIVWWIKFTETCGTYRIVEVVLIILVIKCLILLYYTNFQIGSFKVEKPHQFLP